MYKQKLAEYIVANEVKVLIDLHGMKAKHGIAIELGTGGNGDPTLLGYNFIANTVEEFMQSALDKFLDKDNKKNC